MAVGDLCALADVRLAMETPAADTNLDSLVSAWITVASELIVMETQREIAPATASATRDFRVFATAGYVDLAPYSLRTVTTMTLDPNGIARVLVDHQDYELMPVGGGKWSVYSGVRLLWAATTSRLGIVTLRIQGAWGFATVPPIAKEACVFTVRSWLRRTYPDGYGQFDDARPVQPPLGGYALPLAAKSMLRTLYRI